MQTEIKEVQPHWEQRWDQRFNAEDPAQQEIVDLFDKGHTASYIMRKTYLTRYYIKQILCAAGRTGMFRKRNNSVINCTYLPAVASNCSTTVQYLLDQSCSPSSIQTSQSVSEKGTETSRTRNVYTLTPKDIQKILDLFDEGHTCCYIMQETSVSVHYIKQLLLAAGRTFRGRNQKKYDALRPTVLKLFEQGWSLRAIRDRVRTSQFKVKNILRNAGLPPKTRLAKRSALQSTGYNNHDDTAMILDQNNLQLLPNSCCGKRSNPEEFGHQLDPLAEDLLLSKSPGEARAAGASILLDDGQRGYPTENVGLCQKETGIAQDRSVAENQKGMDIPDVGFDTGITPGQLISDQREKKEEILQYSSASPDECVAAASEMPLLPPDNATMRCSSARYQCQTCRLYWDDEKDFLLHLADKEHEQLCFAGVFLYCTGCKFRTRKPATMGAHIVKYQSQNALQDCSMHCIKLSTDLLV
ncbi:uncharacterized protein LOC129592247 [Paramacrobiotus metropolitanus]|uniref:uncharacterized protein LOC129592247 n=1 Tax=Paramacrobiotus metropolitanus TaxID=2943436 RepID=UPI002445B2B6|nr:uncharacterized protein LOC129592247 [Paramacrobiotus metropolitanus]XP_055344206.1 uncharacterized protein LOC129592247 [Paramacrobiotus metropolitanus]XP_055344207.1 uncharacterized protein LOC129592247 [Paramacrobiotus metropolitanus]